MQSKGREQIRTGAPKEEIDPAARTPALQARRTRIIDATVVSLAERGFAHTTVGEVCARARVSRATFYESFEGLRDCLIAVIDDAYDRTQALVSEAFAGEQCWRSGVRGGLGALLALFDEEPMLARVWLLETLGAGTWALERRTHHLAAMIAMITERWPLPQESEVNPLASAAIVESILGLIQTRMLANSPEPLLELLGPLMGLIGTLYIGPHVAAVEIERGHAHAREIRAERERRTSPESTQQVELPATLRDPRAHRMRQCLHYLAGNPGASNRQIATAVGISRQEQISKLLARLNAMGLLLKRAAAPGGANAWLLTAHGTQVARALHSQRTHLDTYTGVTSELQPSKS
jgi:AcrR family transcriptional regulator